MAKTAPQIASLGAILALAVALLLSAIHATTLITYSQERPNVLKHVQTGI